MDFDRSNIAFSITKSWIAYAVAALWLARMTDLGYESICQLSQDDNMHSEIGEAKFLVKKSFDL